MICKMYITKIKKKGDEIMAIGNAVASGTLVKIFDEKGKQLSAVSLYGGTLIGFTSNTINIKRGTRIYMYDEKGKPTGSCPA